MNASTNPPPRAPGLRIALMNVVMDGDYQYEQEIPLGLASIGAFLRQKNYRVDFHQCFASRGAEECERAAEIQADVYGFQLTLVNYVKVRAVIEGIKRRNANAIVVLGGPFLACGAAEILEREKRMDFIVVGEGEFALLELLERLETGTRDLGDVNGLVWRDERGGVRSNPLRKPVEDLDSLPFPSRDFLETARKDPRDHGLLESVRVVTSRGCVGNCSFCCVNLYAKITKGRRWRGRSPGNVVDELEALVGKYQARLFNFSDSSFEDPGEPGKRRAREICNEIIRRGLKLSAKVYMRCETMRDARDVELLKLYKQAGIDVIIIGAEAGSDYELDLYEKHASTEDNYRTVKLLEELDCFYVLVGFIMFGPYSTGKSLRDNIEFLHQARLADNVMHISNMLMLIKGSKLYTKLKHEGRVIESDDPWVMPRYTVLDPVAERMALQWQNLYHRYPATKSINTLQINIGNLSARMTNPMNRPVLESLRSEYGEFKRGAAELRQTFGAINHRYFLEMLDAIGRGCPDSELEGKAEELFGGVYEKHLGAYTRLYDEFVAKIEKLGVGMSGLVFRPFYSALAINGTERIVKEKRPTQAGAGR